MNRIYFGTKERATWIRAFAPGVTYQPVGYFEKLQYLNGGAGIRRSTSFHMEYALSWPNGNRDAIQAIMDYAAGVYGETPLYWVDPVAKDKNLFNAGWSAPALGGMDAVPLIRGRRPRIVDNLDRSRDYPVKMAQYSVTSADTARSFYTPIPPGYTAWIGAHGIPGAQGLMVRPTAGGVPVGAGVAVPVGDVSSAQRVTHSFGGGDQTGLEISLDTSAEATIALAGLMLQILPSSSTPAGGSFIAGTGHSGCDFDDFPTKTPYMLGGRTESFGLSAKLTEIGDWQ